MTTPVGRTLGLILSAVACAASAWLAAPGVALAHTGEDVPLSHVILEVGQWSLGAAAILAVLLGILWVRARIGRRGE